MNGRNDEGFDLIQNDCEICCHVWFDYFVPDIAREDPNYCPRCGTKFTTKNGLKRAR